MIRDTDRFEFPTIDLAPRQVDVFDRSLHIEPDPPSFNETAKLAVEFATPGVEDLIALWSPHAEIAIKTLEGIGIVIEGTFATMRALNALGSGDPTVEMALANANGLLSKKGAVEIARNIMANLLNSDGNEEREGTIHSDAFNKMYKNDFFQLDYEDQFRALEFDLNTGKQLGEDDAAAGLGDLGGDTDRVGGEYVGDDPDSYGPDSDDNTMDA